MHLDTKTTATPSLKESGLSGDMEKEHDSDSQRSKGATENMEPSAEKSKADQVVVPPATDTKPSGLVEDDWEYITGYKLAIVVGTVTLAAFTMLLDTSIIVTAIPRITTDFHSLDDVGWYGSSYLLASSALQPTSGKLYQQLSSKWTFLSFLGLFELGSLICGVANSSNMLIVGRAVAGMGASGLMNGALTILMACVPLHKRAVHLGIMMSFAQLGILLGPLIGGALTEYTTWRWCFYINLPIGAVVAVILFLIHIPDRTTKNANKTTFSSLFKSLDLFGFALFAPTMIMFLLALEWGGTQYRWGSATIIGLFCGSAGSLVIFLAWEHKKGDEAMVPLAMLRHRIVYSSCMTMFFFFGTLMLTSYYLAIYFQAVKGIQPTLSGVYMLPGILSQMLFATISGILVGKLGYYLPWAIFSGVFNSIGSGLISLYNPTTPTAEWVGFQLIGGIGRGCGMQMPLLAISAFLPPSQNAIGMSLVVFSQTFGGSIWLAVAQTAFSSSLKKALHQNAPNVSVEMVAKAGATGFRDLIPKEAVAGVIESYSIAVSHVFYLAAGAAVAALVFSCGMGWVSVKKQKVVAPEA